MLHNSNDTFRTPSQDDDHLARAFLKILAGDTQRLKDDDLLFKKADPIETDPMDIALGVDATSLPPERSAPRADLCAMAVMLGRKIERTPKLLAQLRHRSPRVCIKTIDQNDVELAIDVLQEAVFARRMGQINPTRSRLAGFSIFGSSTLTPNRIGPWIVSGSGYAASPVVLVSSDPITEAAPEVLRVFAISLELSRIDISCLNLVIETVTGQQSDIALDPQILSTISFSDCAFAILPDRSPDECQAALLAAVLNRKSALATGPRLEQLHGYGAAKGWGLEVVADLQALKAGTLTWQDFPNRSLLLVGPPGSGKTSFAAALARSADVPFIASSVAEWNIGPHLSGTLAKMRVTFASARSAAPCVLLIDELDGISKRSRLSGEHVEFWQQVVNLLLEELDGSARNEGVIVIGATNYADMIDPAILRSGRIDRRIDLPTPGVAELAEIFGFYLGDRFDLPTLMSFAKAAIGKTGADCEVFVRRAKAAARREARPLSATDILKAIGHESTSVSAEVRRRIAVHEAGHAVVALALNFAAVESLTVSGGGGNAKLGSLDPIYTAQSARDHMAVAIAGRAAEELVFGTIGMGGSGDANSDLAIATRIATGVELQLGFGTLGLPYMEADLATVAAVPGVLPAVRRHLDDAMERASSVLIDHRAFLDRLSSELFRAGVLFEEDIERIASSSRSKLRLN
jgi:cell division protease FtsH